MSNDRRKNQQQTANERRLKNRRKSTRIPLDLWVEEERGDELYFRRTGNISAEGLFFERTIPHALGTIVTVRFALPQDARVLQVKAEVVNIPQSEDELGMGLLFTDISDDDKDNLHQYILRRNKN